MARVNENRLRYWGDKQKAFPANTTEAIYIGDLLKVDSGVIKKMTAASDAAGFIGVAMSSKEAGETGKVLVALDGVFEMDKNGAINPFDKVMFSDNQEVVSDDGTGNDIGFAYEVKDTTVLVKIKSKFV